MWLSLVCQASQAWMEWLMKKRKAFDQRGDMAVAAWAEQQQRELNLRARRLSRSKVLYWIKYLDKINHATKWVHKKLLHASSNSLFTDSHFMYHWNKLKQMEPLSHKIVVTYLDEESFWSLMHLEEFSDWSRRREEDPGKRKEGIQGVLL